MRLKYNDIEVEGKTKQEIEWLIARVQSLAKEFKFKRGGDVAETEGGGRGKKETFIQFPTGKFTVKDLAKETGLSQPCLGQRLNKMKNAGDAKIVGFKGGQLWTIVNFPTETEEFTKKKLNIDVNLEDVKEDMVL